MVTAPVPCALCPIPDPLSLPGPQCRGSAWDPDPTSQNLLSWKDISTPAPVPAQSPHQCPLCIPGVQRLLELW